MTTLDKTKKIIYIIAGTLTIILLVFSLMKKIGIAKETTFPIYANKYNFPTIEGYNYETFVQQTETLFNYGNILCYYYEDNGHFFNYLIFPYTDNNIYKEIDNITPQSIINTNEAQQIIAEGNATYYGQPRAGALIITKYELVNGQLIQRNRNEYGYYTLNTSTINRKYIYCRTTLYDKDNNIVFTQQDDKPHAKGGIIDTIQENEEIASEELTQVDNEAPTQDTNANWFQKILNAIKTFNNNYQAGLITITEAIQGNTEAQATIQVLLTELIIRTNELITANSPQEIAESWKRGWAESDAKLLEQSFQHAKGGIESAFTPLENDLILGNWTLKKQAGTLYLIGTIPYPEIFGGVERQYTFTFQWYEQIRNWFVPLITAFYTIALVLGFIKAVPSILQGAGTTIRNAEGAGHTKGGNK